MCIVYSYTAWTLQALYCNLTLSEPNLYCIVILHYVNPPRNHTSYWTLLVSHCNLTLRSPDPCITYKEKHCHMISEHFPEAEGRKKLKQVNCGASPHQKFWWYLEWNLTVFLYVSIDLELNRFVTGYISIQKLYIQSD